jgi:hypothetical protein
MQVLTGKDLELSPHLITSFGGGGGGFSYHYRYVEVLNNEAATITATGYSVPPSWLRDGNFFVMKGDVLYVLLLHAHSMKDRDAVRELLLKDSFDQACKMVPRWSRTDSDTARGVERVQKQHIIAAGHWQYIGPIPGTVRRDYVICFDENFKNESAHDNDDQELAFTKLQDAKDHLKSMGVGGDGLYIVNRTEVIIDA